MSREVRIVTADAPLAAAVETLIGKAYRALPIVDAARRVIGILTDGDLLARLYLPDASVQQALSETELEGEIAALRRSDQAVAELMVSPVVTTPVDAPVAEVVRTIAERGIKRLPVVDHAGRLMGLVNRLDVLRALAQPPVAEKAEHVPVPGAHHTVRDVMLAGASTVPADTPLSQAVDHLVTATERRVVVIDAQQRALGIIIDGDLLKEVTAGERAGLLQALAGRDPSGRGTVLDFGRRTAAKVMTSPVVTVTLETPLLDVRRLLLQRRIKRLPVLDEQGRVVGIVEPLAMLADAGAGAARCIDGSSSRRCPVTADSAGPRATCAGWSRRTVSLSSDLSCVVAGVSAGSSNAARISASGTL